VPVVELEDCGLTVSPLLYYARRLWSHSVSSPLLCPSSNLKTVVSLCLLSSILLVVELEDYLTVLSLLYSARRQT